MGFMVGFVIDAVGVDRCVDPLEFLIYLSVWFKWCFRGKTAYLYLSAKPLFIPVFVNGALKTAPYDLVIIFLW